MSGKRYIGKLPHISKVASSAGFSGIEPETCMLGPYYDDPAALKDVLTQYNLQVGAIALACNWSGPRETDAEKWEAERVLNYLKFFPDTHLVLSQLPGKDRSNLQQRQANAIACIEAIARRSTDLGIDCSFHPNSPAGSVFRIKEDYLVLLDRLDSRIVGFAPDAGHIAKGGMDVIEIFHTYRSLIRHIHFKDITTSREWAAMGAGIIDFPRIVTMMRDAHYDGWIMVEEESKEAEVNPDTATAKNGEYLRKSLLPLV
jgi:inosose dehydratase